MTDSISPFSISVPQDQLDDLSARLCSTRWPDAETVGDNSQGLPLAYAQELANFWEQHYDWRRCEQAMNAQNQFTTVIDDIEIHFHHIKSPHPSARPLL
ncbi:MAG: epoxide hydrolase N-terminal domain-containing protein, partial [Pseudomonadota bacterium]